MARMVFRAPRAPARLAFGSVIVLGIAYVDPMRGGFLSLGMLVLMLSPHIAANARGLLLSRAQTIAGGTS
jgi:hypothetical protein